MPFAFRLQIHLKTYFLSTEPVQNLEPTVQTLTIYVPVCKTGWAPAICLVTRLLSLVRVRCCNLPWMPAPFKFSTLHFPAFHLLCCKINADFHDIPAVQDCWEKQELVKTMVICLSYQGLQITRGDFLCAIYNQILYGRVMLCCLWYSSIRNTLTVTRYLFLRLVNFPGLEEPLWNWAAMLPCSSLQVSGYPENPSKRLWFSLTLAVFSSK